MAGKQLWVCQDGHYLCVKCHADQHCPDQHKQPGHYCWEVCTCVPKCEAICASCPSKQMRRDLTLEWLAGRAHGENPLFCATSGEEEDALAEAILTINWDPLLTCPTCLNMPRPGEDIFCCVNGHLTCDECWQHIWKLPWPKRKCPSCRAEDFGYRALSAEYIISTLLCKLEQECRYDVHGCKIRLPLDQLSQHELTCRHQDKARAKDTSDESDDSVDLEDPDGLDEEANEREFLMDLLIHRNRQFIGPILFDTFMIMTAREPED